MEGVGLKDCVHLLTSPDFRLQARDVDVSRVAGKLPGLYGSSGFYLLGGGGGELPPKSFPEKKINSYFKY